MIARKRCPNRRGHEAVVFEHAGIRFAPSSARPRRGIWQDERHNANPCRACAITASVARRGLRAILALPHAVSRALSCCAVCSPTTHTNAQSRHSSLSDGSGLPAFFYILIKYLFMLRTTRSTWSAT
jgi:hypothetical protein